MIKVLLLSHGYLCRELYNTAKLIVGDVSAFEYILEPENGDMASYSRQIEQTISENEETLVLTDLLGGSPLITLAKIYGEHADEWKDKVRIVTGVNMPMLLEVGTSLTNTTLDELKEKALTAGKTGVVDFLDKVKG